MGWKSLFLHKRPPPTVTAEQAAAAHLASLRSRLIELTDRAHFLSEAERINIRISCGSLGLEQLKGAIASIQRREIIAIQREHLLTGMTDDQSTQPRVMRQ